MYQPFDQIECIASDNELFGKKFRIYEIVTTEGNSYTYRKYRLERIIDGSFSWDIEEYYSNLIENPFAFRKVKPEDEII